MEAARFVAELHPDVIVLTTPHGIETSWDWVFYANSHLKGSAAVGGDLIESFVAKHDTTTGFPHYDVSFVAQGAPALSADLVDAAVRQVSS